MVTLYGYEPSGPGSFGQGNGYGGFGVPESTAMPPQAVSAQGAGVLPDLPGAYWLFPPGPTASYQFAVPQWSTPPAAEEGRWESCELEMTTSYTGTGSELTSALDLRFEFETTELMEMSFAGWYFSDPASGQFMNAPVDGQGRLLPGHYELRTLGAGLQYGPATYTLRLGPVPTDTDGDLLSDYDEVHIHHTDPTKKDTDDDGLSDRQEVRTYLTDPTKADTDGDGYKDGYEINTGKSPLDAQDAPPVHLTIHPAVELRTLTKLGKQYRVQTSKDLQTWTDSETLVEGTGEEIRRVFETADDGVKYWRLQEVE